MKKKTKMKTCDKCGLEKNARGFNLHYNRCKGKRKVKLVESLMADRKAEVAEEVEKVLPPKVEEPMAESLGEDKYAHLKIGLDLMGELEEERKVVQESKEKVFATDIGSVECPECHCVGQVRKRLYMEPVTTYTCKICGVSFQQNEVTKEYYYH